jgi:hypothetical protein
MCAGQCSYVNRLVSMAYAAADGIHICLIINAPVVVSVDEERGPTTNSIEILGDFIVVD